jgi:hypothetical protein
MLSTDFWVQLIKRQFAAIFHLHHFLGVDARAGNELEVVGQVQKANFAVVGVNAVFHGFSWSDAVAGPASLAYFPQKSP